MVQSQILHRGIKGRKEFVCGSRGRDLGLNDDFVPRQLRQQPPQLHFGGTVKSCSLDVIDPQLQCATNGCFHIRLTIAGHICRIHILPLVLVAHAAA